MFVPDYTQLKKYLISQRWREADIETRHLMLLTTGADKRRDILLTETDINNFPCEILLDIDHLWLKSSQQKFGFSTIKNIYSSVNQDYSKLAETVGWKKENDWINCDRINFSNDAPTGHLPLTWVIPSTFSSYWLSRFASAGWKRLLKRLVVCSNDNI